MSRARAGAHWSLLAAILILGVACSDGVEPLGTVASIDLGRMGDTLRFLGQTRQLAAKAEDRQGALISVSVSWSSSAPNTVSVSESGLVTALAKGTARVTARAGGASAALDVVVLQVPAEVTIAAPARSLGSIGSTLQLVAGVADSGGSPITAPPIAWASSDTAVATVSNTGVAHAVRNGTVTITATAGLASGTVPLTVSQVPAQITLTPDAVRLTSLGAEASLTAVVRDSGGTTIVDSPITWTTSNATAVSIDSVGVLTALAFDTATVTATADPVSALVAVRVSRVAALKVSAPSSDMNEGSTLQLSAELTDASGAPVVGVAVVWISDSTQVGTVDAGGLLEARRTGRVQVRAEAEGLEDTTVVRVRGLIHRWTFDESGGAGTVFNDDVGGLQASIVGTGAQPATAVAGVVTLTGGPWTTADYVALPPRLFRDETDVTIEIWATVYSFLPYSAVFDIGPTPSNYLGILWSVGTDPQFDEVAWAFNDVKGAQMIGALWPYSAEVEHHIVLTIDEGGGVDGKTRVAVYRDGERVGTADTDYRLRDLLDDTFWLGRSFSYASTANASYDEVSIHDRVYSDAEVNDLYLRGPVRSTQATSIAILPPPGIQDTVRGVGVRFPLHTVGTDELGREFLLPVASWASSDSSVLTVDSAGVVRTAATGRAVVTASVGALTAQWTTDVVRIRRLAVDPYLATPAPGALWEVPVVLIEYLPTSDGFGLDTLKAPGFAGAEAVSLDFIESWILDVAKRRKMVVEEGSRFHGYKDSTAAPSLGYRVVEHIIVYDQIPPHPTKRSSLPGNPRYEDWYTVFSDLDLSPVMTAQEVRELWVAWASFDGSYPSYQEGVFDVDDMRAGWESNMASPTTGDISNSDRDPSDAPLLSHTYIIYGINYRRTQAEAVHNVGHQLEAMFSHAALLQDGNSSLFWRQFVGQDAQNQFITGRAGWTHMPPNTTTDYDYLNTTLVAADIEDWRPDNSGDQTLVNVNTWGTLSYPWPGAPDFPQRLESQWYTYWFQNMPGRDNRIPHGTDWMTNWWAFVADWDAAITSGLGLYSSEPAATQGSGSLQMTASVLQKSGAGYQWTTWRPGEHNR